MPLYVGLFFCFLGIGASLTTIPFYVLNVLRQRDGVAVGTAVALLSLAVVIARPVAGRLADRYGYKLIMLVGALTCAVAGALYAVASSSSWCRGARAARHRRGAAVFRPA